MRNRTMLNGFTNASASRENTLDCLPDTMIFGPNSSSLSWACSSVKPEYSVEREESASSVGRYAKRRSADSLSPLFFAMDALSNFFLNRFMLFNPFILVFTTWQLNMNRTEEDASQICEGGAMARAHRHRFAVKGACGFYCGCSSCYCGLSMCPHLRFKHKKPLPRWQRRINTPTIVQVLAHRGNETALEHALARHALLTSY